MGNATRLRRTIRSSLLGFVVACGAWPFTPTAGADAVAYLVNVTVRPGYQFPNAEAALDYGYGICDRVDRGTGYAETVGVVKRDFGTDDDYQAGYLINQSVNELCPAMIWQLRQSAAHYTGGPTVAAQR